MTVERYGGECGIAWKGGCENGEEKVVTPFLGLSSYYGSHSGEYNTLINNLVVADGAEFAIGDAIVYTFTSTNGPKGELKVAKK